MFESRFRYRVVRRVELRFDEACKQLEHLNRFSSIDIHRRGINGT